MIHLKVLDPHVRLSLERWVGFHRWKTGEERKTSEMERTQGSKIQKSKWMASCWHGRGEQGPDLAGHKVPCTTLFSFTFSLVISLPSLFTFLFLMTPKDMLNCSLVHQRHQGLNCAHSSKYPNSIFRVFWGRNKLFCVTPTYSSDHLTYLPSPPPHLGDIFRGKS